MPGQTDGDGRGTERQDPPGPTGAARQRLLDGVVAHFSEAGLADQSLRRIAEATGTSHRMLLYHFGSKDGLLLAVVQEVEAQTQERLASVGAATVGDTDELIRRMWAHVADPALGDLERLFFALYGRALQGDEAIRALLDDDVSRWLDANVALSAPLGVPEPVARTHARLGLAVVRGLLLDLLATGDRVGVEAALDAFAARYRGEWWEGAAGTGASDRAS